MEWLFKINQLKPIIMDDSTKANARMILNNNIPDGSARDMSHHHDGQSTKAVCINTEKPITGATILKISSELAENKIEANYEFRRSGNGIKMILF